MAPNVARATASYYGIIRTILSRGVRTTCKAFQGTTSRAVARSVTFVPAPSSVRSLPQGTRASIVSA